ncbi:hypothetical protein QFZ23_001933 [Arthrobacter globiformis]|nr:hypothetical protein [Arthrobacter globiformis]MDQ1058032.1 hypothetical protein [Arthrobacter globiformis]
MSWLVNGLPSTDVAARVAGYIQRDWGVSNLKT